MDEEEVIDLLGMIARDESNRVADRLKAFEFIIKLLDLFPTSEALRRNPITFIDDIPDEAG